MSTSVNAGARLDRLPISRFHWKILFLIGAGVAIDAFDIYLGGTVMAATVKTGFATLHQGALFISLTFTGMLIGAGAAGYVGDRFGRRYSYQTNLLVFGLAAVGCWLAPNMPMLIVGRFIMGVGLGAEVVVATGTLCEFVPPAYRGRWAALMSLMIHIGVLAATGLSYLIIPRFGWRVMFLIAALGALVIWIMRKRMPESPRWLESVGREAEAQAVLERIEAEVARHHGSLPPVQLQPSVTAAADGRSSLAALFARGQLRKTLVGTVTGVTINIALYGFLSWIPTFLVKQGLEVSTSLGFATIIAFGGPLGVLAGLLFTDRVGRKKGLIGFAAVSAVLGVAYSHLQGQVLIGTVGFLVEGTIYGLATIGLYGFIPELFPTAIRLRGTGWCGVCSRGASIGMPYLTVMLFERFGVSGVTSMVAGVLLLLIVTVGLFSEETSQRSLESIALQD
ncbi:sugar (and other) transporter family protein [Paraburkholderia xenovorans LB400]|uniref:Major facilitator superfamily (MFS) aromatic acid/H+ symporter n=1 Tax=Paraburkholderia xenovorans (strain LB400) TaxID=266265 RepID=Q13GT0_PARXL|nr:MFS transporter [Paraburkholderia xenovorans]ABE36709.1 major facilitator superfamily (MFS) aromatic acid/H+ symporter [Paraburkholderia xenovorans LB400]AIP33895.1 sugar (and other) transporter family protein [Paraburkholderia xenovorans LB400]